MVVPRKKKHEAKGDIRKGYLLSLRVHHESMLLELSKMRHDKK